MSGDDWGVGTGTLHVVSEVSALAHVRESWVDGKLCLHPWCACRTC